MTGAANISTAAYVFIGLTEGAKIGIGVGIPLGVLVFASLCFFVFWRKQRQARAARGEEELPSVLNLAGRVYSPEDIPVPSFLGGDGQAEPDADEKPMAPLEQQPVPCKDKIKIPKRGAGRNPNTGYASIEQRLEMSEIGKIPQKTNKGNGRATDTGVFNPGNPGHGLRGNESMAHEYAGAESEGMAYGVQDDLKGQSKTCIYDSRFSKQCRAGAGSIARSHEIYNSLRSIS